MQDLLRTVIALVVVLVAGWLGFRFIFPSPGLQPVLVQVVEGTVHHVDAQGVRSQARAGQLLDKMDRLETEADGRARLSLGEDMNLTLYHSTGVRLLGIDSGGLRVELNQGRVEATVRPGRRSLGILSGDMEVSARDASFAVGLSAEGAMAVESRAGALQVTGVEGVEELSHGQRLSMSPAGDARFSPVPEALLLEVAWPEEARTRQAEVAVRGITDPGAQVRVGASGRWATVIAGEDGAFEASVPLEEGENPLQVISQDPLGRSTRSESLLTRDPPAPGPSTFEVRY